MPGWNLCKLHAEDAPRLSKYHAKVFGMTPQKPKTKQNTPSTSTIYAGTRQNLRSHASTPRISKLHAEDLRRDIHRFHPGLHGGIAEWANACYLQGNYVMQLVWGLCNLSLDHSNKTFYTIGI